MGGYSDEATRGAIARAEQAERQAEADVRAREEARQTEARAELGKVRERELFLWMSRGGTPEMFEKQWPDQVGRIMREKQERRDQELQRASVWR